MSLEPTYQFYKDTYYGQASEVAFKASLRTAINKVNYIIYPNEVTDETLEAYQIAICAAVDVDIAHGGSGGVGENTGSMSVGSFSISSGSSGGALTEYENEIRRAIEEPLVGTGLLFMGLE